MVSNMFLKKYFVAEQQVLLHDVLLHFHVLSVQFVEVKHIKGHIESIDCQELLERTHVPSELIFIQEQKIEHRNQRKSNACTHQFFDEFIPLDVVGCVKFKQEVLLVPQQIAGDLTGLLLQALGFKGAVFLCVFQVGDRVLLALPERVRVLLHYFRLELIDI